jgi:uridine phosphorylase
VLLPGDPGRALALAQELLEAPRMFNHNRGLWGYTGAYADGEPMTIQATGLGGPSAAIVLEELVELGLERAIRVGSATALDSTLALGELLVVERALCADGTSAALGALGEVEPDAGLLAALRRALPDAASGAVVSSDLYYEHSDERLADWRGRGARALELASAALFALGARRGVSVGCVLALVDRFDAEGEPIAGGRIAGERERIGAEARAAAEIAAGRAGATALAAG